MSKITKIQGSGETYYPHATPPATNIDGTPFTFGPEDFYRYYLNSTLVGAVTMDASNQMSNGEDIDAMDPGVYSITYSTVNRVAHDDPLFDAAVGAGAVVTPDSLWADLEGPVNPDPLVLTVAAPLAPPLYPSDIS